MRRGRTAIRLRIRPARPSDAAACAAVMRAAIRALPAGLHSAGELTAWASLPALYHRWAMGPGGERYLLAEVRGRVVGYAAHRGAELTAVFVRPGAQRRGIARALVRRVAVAAQRTGAAGLRVDAALSAEPFYRAIGFEPLRRTRVALPGGARLATVRMRLRLRTDRAPAIRRAAHRRRASGPSASRQEVPQLAHDAW